MKNLLTLAFLVLSSALLLSQSPNLPFLNFLNAEEIAKKELNIGDIEKTLVKSHAGHSNEKGLQSRSPVQILTGAITYRKDLSNQTWNKLTKVEYGYSQAGELNTATQYKWDGSTWINVCKYEYTYDANGYEIQSYYHFWENGQWAYPSKYDYSYDGNGNLTDIIGSKFDFQNQQWVLSLKLHYEYDSNEHLIRKINLGWNSISNAWDTRSKVEYTNNSNGKLSYSKDYNWNGSTWIQQDKAEYTYGSNGKDVSEIKYYSSHTTSNWTPSAKDVFQYDNHGEVIKYDCYIIDPATNQFTNHAFDSDYEFDYNYTIDDLIVPYNIIDQIMLPFTNHFHKIVFANSTSFETAVDKTEFIYEDISSSTTGTKDESILEISITPNPTSNNITVHSNQNFSSAVFVLVDLNGKEVFQKDIFGRQQLELNGISKGMYVYRISSGERIFNGKLLVE